MTTETVPSVGIDLGTTFSVVARLSERGEVLTLVNAEGDRTTPSAVLFDGDNTIVGKEALKAMATEPENVAECSKRDVGYQVFHKEINGRTYPPEAIEAIVLNKLRTDIAQQIGPFSKVVITVPAYFDEVRRKATQDAGYMAGLEVLDIINEPTAAAVAFAYQHGFLGQQAGAGRPTYTLVYDLGGGTFDVTVMETRDSDFVVLATDGDVRLGGWDWDQRLVDLVAASFQAEHGIDPREDPRAAGKLWRECEDAKHTLSRRDMASVHCEYGGFSSRVEISRQQFEEATRDLLEATRFTTVHTLGEAKLDSTDIEHVLMVGGSTRMPMVRQMLGELLGQEPDASLAADEAVAHGAALHANLLLANSQGRPPDFSIQDVNSHSLGVVATDAATGEKRNAVVIPRNTPLPVTRNRMFRTMRDDQRSILVEIVEGESPSPENCTPLGQCTVRDLPPGLAAQSPVDVSFQYEPNGRLRVRVTVPQTDRQTEVEIVRENSLDKETIDAWRRWICGMEPTAYQ